MEDFIKNFADQFDETSLDQFAPEIRFHDLEEWSSLVGLAVLNMMAKKYGVKMSPAELRAAVTVEDLYRMTQPK